MSTGDIYYRNHYFIHVPRYQRQQRQYCSGFNRGRVYRGTYHRLKLAVIRVDFSMCATFCSRRSGARAQFYSLSIVRFIPQFPTKPWPILKILFLYNWRVYNFRIERRRHNLHTRTSTCIYNIGIYVLFQRFNITAFLYAPQLDLRCAYVQRTDFPVVYIV
jgi:hypothetical protein